MKKMFFLFFVLALISCASTSNETPELSGYDRVYFANNKSDICKKGKEVLDKQVEVLKSSNKKIVIEGYCDSIGTPEYNLELGKKRAESVKKYLVEAGIDESKIEVISYGSDKILDEKENSKNRVVITTLK